ncbi:MAG: chaperone modulator CbpM [Burkholderiaceae bacterium]|nr:chaperone modulator CbpM [Burkholderiaceae bacterium]
MSQYQTNPAPSDPQVFDDDLLELQEVARICCVNLAWLHERIEQQVIEPIARESHYYFTSATVTRIQRVVQVERTYDADPQLAALVADLTEEVQALRQQIKRLSASD